MRKRWLALILVLTPVFSFPQNPSASLEGTVVDRVTSRGIAGADTLLTGIVQGRVVNLTGKTNAGGQFRFEKVPPSDYWLRASHGEKHIDTIYRQRGLYGTGEQIPVSAGQRIVDLRLEMVPTGEISGRVLNAEGRPVSGASVSAQHPRYRQGVAALFPVSRTAQTNRLGEYKINGLPPEPLYLEVGIPNSQVREIRSSSLLPGYRQMEYEDYPVTYFPATADDRSAKAVNLHAGERLTGIDIAISKVRTLRVRGTVIDGRRGQRPRPANLMLVRRHAQPESAPGRTVEVVDGSFDLRNVLPGSYFLIATAMDGQTRLTGRAPLEVGAQDLSGITVRLMEGFNVAGNISVESSGDATTIDRSQVSVALRPMPPASYLGTPTSPLPTVSASGPGVTVLKGLVQIVEFPVVRGAVSNGALTFQGVRPWDYYVEVSHPYEDVYLRSIRLDGRDVTATGIAVDSPPTAQLEIVMRTPAARIEGRVLNSQQKPEAALRVVLLPDKEHRGRHDLYRTVLTDREGKFQIHNLAPGDYQLFAWEFVEDDAWRDPNYLLLYEGKGVSVHVDEGTPGNLTLQTIPPWY